MDICANSICAGFASGSWQIEEIYRASGNPHGNNMDLTADMLTIIRNAQLAKRATAKAPYSKVNFGISEILKKEGWVKNLELKKRGEKAWIIIELAYESDGAPVIRDIQKISKQGQRMYAGYKEIPTIIQGYGLVVISTPNGIMTGKEARKQKVGGEILCKVL